MVFKEQGFSQGNEAEGTENASKNENAEEFMEKLKDIEIQVGLINAVGDDLDKDSKLNALKVIEELKTAIDLDRKKDLISDLKRYIGLIDVWSGDKLDKDSKTKAQELIERLD